MAFMPPSPGYRHDHFRGAAADGGCDALADAGCPVLGGLTTPQPRLRALSAHIPHIEFVNRTEFPPNGGRLFQVLPA
jgi:hypothetical protein